VTALTVLAVVGALAWWQVSLRIHPNRTCGRCGGKGEVFGSFFGTVRGPCSRCRGTGKVPRRGGRSPLS
jgi:DnaJ-class molecular chaperone